MAAPLAPNCQGFVLDANGKVTGVQLGITTTPGAQYEVYSVRLRDEYEAAGQTVANCSVYDKNNIPTGLPVRLTWPGKQPPFQDSGLPGNANNQHVIVNGYAPPNIGPLALHTGPFNAPTSDIVWGLGLPNNRHVSWDVTFKEKGAVTVPPPVDPPPVTGKPLHRFGVHLINAAERDMLYIQALQPAMVRMVNPDPGAVRRVLATTPAYTLVHLRDHLLSEEKAQMAADPVGTGLRHANWWIEQLTTGRFKEFGGNKRILVNGINEPPVHNPAEEAIVIAYNKARLERLTAAGIRSMAFDLSVGWPREVNGVVQWEAFRTLEKTINDGSHLANFQSYFYPTPQDNWAKLMNRVASCPMQVPMVMAEVGYTRQLAQLQQPWGWRGNISAAQYAEMLWYCADNVDPRVVALCCFTSGFGGPEWESKDVTSELITEILKRKHNYSWPTTPPPPPPVGDLSPIVWPKTTRITTWYGPTHSGLDIALPTGYPLYAMHDGTVAWSDVDTAANGGYGIYCRCRYPALGFDSLYGHMSVCYKKTGDKVVRGEKIGEVGSTGNSTGSHLHLEIRISGNDGISPRANVGPFGRGQVDPMGARWSLEKVLGVEER